MQIIKKQDQALSTWAGGTTTQLAIGPTNADYSTRSFGWRISTATVNLPESPFTILPNVHRHLMVLSGTLTLDVENPHLTTSEHPKLSELILSQQVELTPFDICQFDGGLSIIGKSTEPVVDFNLMTKPPFYGDLATQIVEESLTLANIGDILGLYVWTGQLTDPPMACGDFLITEDAAIHLVGNARVIIAYISEGQTQ